MNKTFCDIEFLKIWYASSIASKFLHIKVYKRHLQSTAPVQELQHKLLEKRTLIDRPPFKGFSTHADKCSYDTRNFDIKNCLWRLEIMVK